MPQASPLEALAAQVFRDGFALTEALVSKPLQVALGTELAGQMLSLARDGYSAGRQTGDEALEQTWQGLRLASHGQVARLAGLVVQVDERTADLEDRIADLEAMVARTAALYSGL